MNLIQSACLIFLFPVSAVYSQEEYDNRLLYSNNLYQVYNVWGDSIVVVDQHGEKKMYDQESNRISNYCGLYKDQLISFFRIDNEHTNLVTFNLVTNKIDTIFKSTLFPVDNCIDAYEDLFVIRDFERYGIVDLKKKKMIREAACELINILLAGPDYYLIVYRNVNVYESQLFLYKGNISKGNDRELIRLPSTVFRRYDDATTYGWNGMAIHEGILFMHAQGKIFAYEIKQNKIITEIDTAESLRATYQLDESRNPVFVFKYQDFFYEKVVFDMKNKSFNLSN